MEIETRMSIEEINMADENIVEIEISEAFPFSADGILDDAFEDKYVLLDGGALNDIHSSTVTLDDVLETCATLGSQDSSHHGALDGRDQPNQHPIEAIEGLREELDDIEALQTVYSNESGLANYYLWADKNEEKENRFGYFVSKLSDNKIKIIENKDEDVFGVVADTSAFIGGQADTPRNHQYGLIAYTGEAVVRCEADVKIGDCVTTNDVGIAQKSLSGHGYRVSATSRTNDFHYYATISLDVSANQLDTLGTDIDSLENRMDDAEVNITTANTLASTAYQLAKAANTGDIGALNASTVAKAEEALDKADSALANTEYLNAQIQSAVQSATQAKTIAANAVTSATSMKNEAVAKSNQALSEVASTRTELQAQVNQTKTDLDKTKSELINSIDEVDGAIADFKTKVEDTYATQEMLTAYQTESSTSLTNYKQEVEDTYATQEMVSLLEKDTSQALTDYKQEVSDTYATQEVVSQYKKDANDALTQYQQEVKENYATQQMLTDLQTNTTKALSDYKQEVTDTYAKTETLNSFQDQTGRDLNTLTQKADANGAYIEGFVANIDKYSYGRYSQANRFTYEEALNILEPGMVFVPSETPDEPEIYAKTTDDYPEMTCTFTKGFSYTWDVVPGSERLTWIGSTVQDVVFSAAYQVGGAFTYWVATDNCEHEGVSYEKDCLYKWENGLWIKVATLKGNLGAVTTSILKQTSNSIETAVSDVNKNYAGTKTWVEDNKTAIQSVVEWHGDNSEALATTIQQASDAEAYIGQIASVKNEDGTVDAIASIVAEVNKDGSTVSIDADKINFKGYASFATDKEGQITSIKGDMIQTGLIQSKGYTKTSNSKYSDIGTCLNLDNGSIISKNFAISSEGKAYFQGHLDAPSGNIGNFVIGGNNIHRDKQAYNDDTDGVYLGTDGIGLGAGTFYVDKEGALTAEKGKIGGWEITDAWLKSDGAETGVYCGLYSGNYPTDQGVTCNRPSLVTPGTYSNGRFYAGASGGSEMIGDSKFTVLDDGSLYASAAKIEGDITATSGKIGGWELNSTTLVNYSGAQDAEGYYSNSFCMQTSGETVTNVLAIGRVAPTNWNTADFRVTKEGKLYATGAEIQGNITATTGKIGGLEIKDGDLLYNGKYSYAPTIRFTTQETVYDDIYNRTTLLNQYGLELTRTQTSDSIDLYSQTYLAPGAIKFQDGYSTVYMSISVGVGHFLGSWNFTSSASTDSDKNLKNNIQVLCDAYDIVFDNLCPRIFKYNNGTSDRYHIGFIAQEVDDARQKAGLTRKDFAAVCVDNEGAETEHWGLRYDEFISLNTWQIQKLKTRVAELEERIAKLENK